MTDVTVIRLFGRPSLAIGGEVVRLPSPQTYLVLARMIFARGATLDRRDLALELWPESSDPLGNLRRHIHYLGAAARRAPDASPLVESTASLVRLRPNSLAIDLIEFETAAREARLEIAIDLAERELMIGYDDPVVSDERKMVDARLREMLEQMIERERFADPQAALRLSRRLLALDPYRDDSVRVLMRSLADCGDRRAALEVFREFEDLLERDVQAAPSPETESFARALSSAGERKHQTLQRDLTSFVGRERDCERLMRGLATHRLITLTGPPGVGKTRLAKEAALRFTSGPVARVDLASSDAAHLESTILASMRPASQTRFEEAIAAFEGLVILDTCEHVVDAARVAVAKMLNANPTLRVLATSRRRLEAEGEALWRVEPLEPPAAARLFFDRLASARADADRSVVDVVAVAEIVRALDGIPLAIEIAAAQLRSTSLAELRANLHERAEITRDETAGTRVGSLLVQTFLWSERLLSDAERAAFYTLGVFVGDFDLDAAAAAFGTARSSDAVGVLDRLVADSLVTPPAVDASHGSYALLQSVREFVLERLGQDPANERAVRARVAKHYLQRVIKLSQRGGPSRQAPSAEIRPIAANVRAALDEAVTRAVEPSLGLAAAVALAGYFAEDGLVKDATAWYSRGLALIAADDPVRPHALRALAMTTRIGGDAGHSLELARESLLIFRDHGDAAGAIRAAVTAGNACMVLDRRADARAFAAEGMALLDGAADPEAEVLLLQFAGQLALSDGDVGRAQTYYERSLLASADGGTGAASVLSVVNLAVCAIVGHHYDRASALAEEALRSARANTLRHHAAWAHMLRATIAWRSDDVTSALRMTGECLELARPAGIAVLSIRILEEMAWYLARRGRGREAARYLGAAGAARHRRAIPLAPVERGDADAREIAARSAAGDVAFDTASKVGATLSLDVAVDEARGAISAGASGTLAV